ncbi:MAG: signal recognition particle-docking protein FtsY [Spirochaetaceae bacterium]|jgi:fused signal recognition particle receptor|nr:signal recognition particle-docking protein FtsY [Spirochaetaceae bacterium]
MDTTLPRKRSFAEKFKSFFSGSKKAAFNGEFFDDCCDALIEGDIGPKTALGLIEAVQKNAGRFQSEQDVLLALKSLLVTLVRPVDFVVEPGKTTVFLVLGVNGAGKTTTIAKLAGKYRAAGLDPVIAASDTFRAAAIDQLKIHGERLGVRVVAHQNGADPGAVIFDAAAAVAARGGGLVLADTAGRLHNKENLLRELQKIDRICASKADEGRYKKILVIDATTGQNAFRQAETFHQALGVDGLVLTKWDSTSKGGALFPIGKELGIPVFRVCFGEGYDDIAPFDPEAYADEFLGLSG